MAGTTVESILKQHGYRGKTLTAVHDFLLKEMRNQRRKPSERLRAAGQLASLAKDLVAMDRMVSTPSESQPTATKPTQRPSSGKLPAKAAAEAGVGLGNLKVVG